ncbi:MAG: translation initiation factor 2 [Desulfovibrio sp.]|jgi:hypothetical protein|nr:translation initiation factor 2 [Desulfovibrio sp.]
MRSVFVFFTLILLAVPASALDISKNTAQYARDMEEYYKNGKPEVLPGLLRAFEARGVLVDGEKRLVTAAFLAEILRRDPAVQKILLAPQTNFGEQARKTLAWAAHLACLPNERSLLETWLQKKDDFLLRQIQASPAPLERWNIYAEPSVLRMYWAAFLASGDLRLLDDIVAAALHYADLNAAGLNGDADFAVSAAAAALLYDQAPGHVIVQRRLQAILAREAGNAGRAGVLREILRAK